MGNTIDQIKGKAEVAGGAIEKTAGKIFGNEKMQAEGEIRERKGQARQVASRAVEHVKDAVKQVKADVKADIHAATRKG